MRFGHLSDIHLGFQKHESLQKIEQDVFERAIDECIARKVDFVLIPGDIFHVNIPEMRVQKFAFSVFRKLYENNIPAYVVYGSHDFSPVSNSVIDLLAETKYIIKVTDAESGEDGRIRLGFKTDGRTGAKIAGLSGLKVGMDQKWYEVLDREDLESEPGFKIFLFHGGIADMKTDTAIDGQHMPLSLLPRGFSYYAGGHMHKYNYQSFPDYPHIVYPGTLFAGHHLDLEENAKGIKRGLVIVEFEDAVKSVDFVPIPNMSYKMIEIDAKNRGSDSVNRELHERTKDAESEQKMVIIKIHGEMASGKTSDISISDVRDKLTDSGALAVNISRNQLTSKEYSITGAVGASNDEIETNVLAENIGQLRFSQQDLLGERGVHLAKSLLRRLEQRPLTNEKKSEYELRVCNDALATMGVDLSDP